MPPPDGGGGVNRKALIVIVAAIVLVVAGVVGVAVALTSGDDGKGDPGDTDDAGFCPAYQDYLDSFLRVDFEAPQEEQVQTMVNALKDYAAALEDRGAPDDMPEDARDGMELFVGWADKLDPDDFSGIEDFESFEDQFSEEENAAGEAFFGYVEEVCGGPPTDVPSLDLPTDLPTALPTELPPGLPSDFLSDIPSEFLTMLPSDFLSDIPSEYLTMIPSELLTMFPTQ